MTANPNNLEMHCVVPGTWRIEGLTVKKTPGVTAWEVSDGGRVLAEGHNFTAAYEWVADWVHQGRPEPINPPERIISG